MLIEFTSPAGAKIEMTEQMSIKMINMMGYTKAVIPGAIKAEDIVVALGKLQVAVEVEAATEVSDDPYEKPDSFMDVPVSIRSRTFPLMELLKKTAKKQTYLMWDYTHLEAVF
jgi:hypothetical protein